MWIVGPSACQSLESNQGSTSYHGTQISIGATKGYNQQMARQLMAYL